MQFKQTFGEVTSPSLKIFDMVQLEGEDLCNTGVISESEPHTKSSERVKSKKVEHRNQDLMTLSSLL